MEIKTMSIDELQERKAAIGAEVDALEDIEAVNARNIELDEINAEIEARKALAEAKAEVRAAVANGQGEVIEKPIEEKKTMTNAEIRKSAEYVDAYARYVVSGDDKECRALLTEAVSGTVPVPVLVDEIVRTAWNNDEILTRVRKTNFRGNLKVAFERSADAAVVHTEGTSAPSEESLVLGIVTMIPANVKKWIRISDEAIAMGGEAFLRYAYDELTKKIIAKLADLVVGDIAGANTSHSATAVGVPKVSADPALGSVVKGMGYLSDQAKNLVVIMNRLTFAAFKTAQYAGNYAMDIFEGLPVLFSDALPAYATASTNDVYAIVGDLDGVTVNYPEGEGVVLKYDDLSEAEADMVKIVGRQYAAHAVTAPGMFANITKPAAVTT